MMAPVKQCGIRPLWAATAIAFMVNNLLPARLGELVRAFVIGRSQNVSRSASFATIVYERVVDVFVLILLLWFCMVRISGPEWLARSAEVLVVFNVALFALLFAMVRWRERFRLLIARVVRPLPPDTQRRMHDSADAFVVGLGVLLVTLYFADVPLQQPVWALIFALLGGGMLGALGIIAGIWADKFDQLAAFQNFVIIPLTFLAGVFYSVNTLPPVWQVASHLNPFFYLVDGFRYGFFGVADVSPAASAAVVSDCVLGLTAVNLRLLAIGYKLRH